MKYFFISLAAAYFVYALIPAFYNRYLNPQILRNTGMAKQLVLTFDDGPSGKYTGALLDILAKHQIKVTFFLVAKEAEKYPQLVGRMLEEGHSLGLHSLEHKNALVKGYRYTKEDFSQSMRLMALHKWPVGFYRAPWGIMNILTMRFVRKYDLLPVCWSVMTEDWSAKATAASIEEKLLRRARDGAIICLHDNGKTEDAPAKMLEALNAAIPKLKAAGYSFVKLTRA